MNLPDPLSYFDVNADSKFSGTTLEKMTSYLTKFDKQLDNKVKRLYNEQTIRYFKIPHDTDFTYVASSCYAEYRRGVSYEVDLLYDKSGSIMEAQCECPAGEGPIAHCKHVCAVIYASIMFTEFRNIKVEETCTQQLQSFHKCKRFLGSPIKSQNISMPGADEFTNMDFDPRPDHLRNLPGYNDYFRNLCLNFSGISTMPVFQLFEPANAFAVAHDHDYMKLTPEDNFLERIGLLNITKGKVNAIEERTRGQANNSSWKNERTLQLPSSMYGRICKATERTDMMKLAISLTVVSDFKAVPLEHGRRHENTALQRYMEDTGIKVNLCGLFVSLDFPHLASSPDWVVSSDLVVEIKCPYTSRNKPINIKTVPYLKKDENETYFLDDKHDYFYQIQGQILCTGAKDCTLVVCHADNLQIKDIKYVPVARDDAFIFDMIDKLNNFYNVYFKPALLDKYFYKPFYN